jgi:hypothetical protein
MQGRHEIKHCISLADYYVLRQRLRAVLKQDAHAGPSGSYEIRSLYFDTAEDKALHEKLDGVRDRDKYRIRFYNHDTSVIHLEKKSKRVDIGFKTSAPLTAEECRRILQGDIEWMESSEHALVRELGDAMRQGGMKPKTIVDYTRDPFTYEAGNVRVTLDHHIRTGLQGVDFLDPDCVTIPAAPDMIILEVKWDNYLPDLVREVVQVPDTRAEAFSKYAICRAFE